MAEGFAPIEIFCCYAREDETWLRKLETHLSLIKQQGLISLWYDRLVLPGANWAKTIDTHLETASVILLLVSSDFFASDYCYGIEMQRALEREAAGEARVVPILVRPVDWRGAPFAHLQVLPTDAKPIASWPNKDTALTDVAAGLRRVIVEELPQLSASAPRAALPKIWNVPYPRNPFFLGHDAELVQIRHNLHAGQATALSQPQAISGLGGIGKTQLALEYAYRYHQDYTAVLWARAESTEALVSSYVALATLLRLPERETKEQEVTVQAVKTWLQTHRTWLLILDNADDLALLPAFLPPALAGHLLLTTRAAATGRLARRLEIETLSPEQGALLLLRRATFLAPDGDLSHVGHQEQEQARQISEELGGLPLALDQTGAYLEETGCSFTDYQQMYRQHRDELLRKRGGLVADHPEPVATTWSLSFEQARRKYPAAADLLCVCAFLAPDAIPEEILMTGASALGPVLAPIEADPFLLNQGLEALRAYSLIQRNPTEKTLSIHRLVQAVLQETLSEEEQHTWRERAMLAINAAFPDAEYETWPQCERLLLQALAATQISEQDQIIGSEAGRLFYKVATYLQDRARYIEAEPLHLRALRIWEQVLGLEDRQMSLSRSLNALAQLYWRQGKFAEAEPLYLRALHIWEQAFGPEYPEVARVLNNLAILYRNQNKFAEAEPLYLRALHIWEQAFGPEYPEVARVLNNLAELYRNQGKFAEAEPLYLRALHIWEQAFGPEHPQVTSPLNGLANLYCDQGRYVEAEPLYLRVLYILEQQFGHQYHLVSYPLEGLAELYRNQGKYAEAEPLYLRAQAIREQQLGLQHPDTAAIIHNIASFREAQGNSEEARTLYARALLVREQAFGAQHPQTIETRTCLIALLHTMEWHEQAAQLEAIQSEP